MGGGGRVVVESRPAARQWVAPAGTALLVLVVAAGVLRVAMGRTDTFTNPILAQGQDPSVVYTRGAYYLAQSDGDAITLYRSQSLATIANGDRVTVGGVVCCQIWAPELVGLDGRWYLYYSAAPSDAASRRMFVLESAGADPLGPYHARGQIAAATDRWATDGTVLVAGATRYFIWSGWPGPQDGVQNLYIARMSNPWTLAGDRALLSAPTGAWEVVTDGTRRAVEEGPEVLWHAGHLFVVFSANGSWTDDYCLGLLRYVGGALTDAQSWVKAAGCVFATNRAAGVYGPGHNSFTMSPDGKQSWLVYHANSQPGAGWAGRSVRAQPFTWRADGSPDFGTPAATAAVLRLPTGE